MTVQDQIKLFFTPPSELPVGDGLYSSLYLLRRDINTCFGLNPNDGSPIDYKALFPGVITIMAGIDLMAKFAYGDGGKVGDRFVKFTKQYISLNNSHELYLLRCCLVHSFGLYTEKEGRVYKFILSEFAGESMICVDKSGRYWIAINQLKAAFDKGVIAFKSDVLSSKTDRTVFGKMFKKYGTIGIRKEEMD